MHIVFGIGNPGPEYEGTRHNVGFRVVERLAQEAGLRLAPLPGVAAEGGETRMEGRRTLLVKPLSFVNRCGPVLARLVAREKALLQHSLVVVDDFHLDLGRLRLRAEGSDGGHNGLRSIAQHVGGPAYPRLRFGIGSPGERPTERFVLERFPASERAEVEAAVERAAVAVREWLRMGTERAMAEVNRRDLDPGRGGA